MTKYENEYGIEIAEDESRITIDGETHDVSQVFPEGSLPILICDGVSFYVARDSEAAGEAVKEYYRDMIESSPSEFVSLVGSENLISWGMGKWAGTARNLEDWLDQVANEPEYHWGIHDFTEYEIDQVSQGIVDDLGFVPSVAYRCS